MSSVPDATVTDPDSNTVDASTTEVRASTAHGDTHDVTGDATFVNNTAVVGLTSTFDEFVHMGREQVMEVFEEALGDVVVLHVECNINGLLEAAEVFPPHNESLGIGSSDPTYSSKVDFAKVGGFERGLKRGDDGEGKEEKVQEDASWAVMTGTGNGNKALYQQVRSFLGDFFDHDKELNAVVAQTTTANPRALVLLDDQKIKDQLRDLRDADGATFTDDGTPKARDCLATNLLSVRQVAQVLEAFADMGVGKDSSRVVRAGTEANGYTYKYRLHAGDSIIGETRIFDSDAVSADKQYAQTIKVQITQSADGAWAASDTQHITTPAIWGGNGDADRTGAMN